MEKTSFLDKMKYGPRNIIVTGHFGSGKTEFAVSLAFALSQFLNKNDCDRGMKESKLALADLDIENPYFRSREQQEKLNAVGVKVYSDPFEGRNNSELQVISASIMAPIQDEDCRTILDVGGDKTGAMVLNQFSRHFRQDYQLLCMVNCNRPGTDTVEKALEQIREIEYVTGLKVSGLISNAHLVRYTRPEDVISGFKFTREVSESSGIPVLCACASDTVAEQFNSHSVNMELFRIGMYMRDTYLDKNV